MTPELLPPALSAWLEHVATQPELAYLPLISSAAAILLLLLLVRRQRRALQQLQESLEALRTDQLRTATELSATRSDVSTLGGRLVRSEGEVRAAAATASHAHQALGALVDALN